MRRDCESGADGRLRGGNEGEERLNGGWNGGRWDEEGWALEVGE